ncbi:MAG TPA: hypothetical protein VGF55_01025 [Gemmataceae bacterium]|jgi:chromosome segregation ATPase
MTVRASVRSILIASAAAGLLLAIGHTPAQAPPPATDVEQRLKALEDKMDRVLKALEARDARPAAVPAATAAVKVARDKVRAELETKEQAYRDLQQKNPYALFNIAGKGGARSIFAERLGRIETRRAELQIKMQEMTDQLAQIEKQYKEGGAPAARRAINALGVRLNMYNNQETSTLDEQLLQLRVRRQQLLNTLGANHPRVKEIDETIRLLKQIYAEADVAAEGAKKNRPESDDVDSMIAAMKEEIKSLDTTINSLNNMFDAESAKAREMGKYEAEGEKLRAEVTRLRQMLAGLDTILRGDMPSAK